MRQALAEWGVQRLYLSLDTTLLWNCFCVIWVGVVYRGRTVPLGFRVISQASSSVRLWHIQRVLYPVAQLMPEETVVVLLADRGFADGKLMKYLQHSLKWHFRIRIKRRFQYQVQGESRWRKVADLRLPTGQAYFTGPVRLGKTKPYGDVYLAVAHDQPSDEEWLIVSDEPTTLQTLAQYRLRFQVEKSQPQCPHSHRCTQTEAVYAKLYLWTSWILHYKNIQAQRSDWLSGAIAMSGT